MMQEEMEAQVWQRVLQRPQTQPNEELLRDWIADSLAAQSSYLTMARISGKRSYRAMAQTEAAQVKELSALRFLLYGTSERVYSGAAEGKRLFSAAVRSRYAAETAAEKSFREAARQWQEHAEVFRKMAATAAHHREILRREAVNYANSPR